MSSQRGATSLWDENIGTVRITVHNTGAHQHSELSENHATQYYLLSASRSIQLNMKTEPGFIDGVYVIEPKSYHQSSSEIRHFDYTAAAPFTPRMVDQLLKSYKFDDYTFTNGGIGCRYWNILVVYVLESKGYVANGSAFDLLFKLPYKFSTRCQPSEWRIRQGTFDHPQTQRIAVGIWEKFEQSINQRKAEIEYAISSLEWIQTYGGANPTAARERLEQLRLRGYWTTGQQVSQALALSKSQLQRIDKQLADHKVTAEEGRLLVQSREDEDEDEDEVEGN